MFFVSIRTGKSTEMKVELLIIAGKSLTALLIYQMRIDNHQFGYVYDK